MDNKELCMKDVNDNSIDAFVYDGTTYVPARAISDSNGKMRHGTVKTAERILQAMHWEMERLYFRRD